MQLIHVVFTFSLSLLSVRTVNGEKYGYLVRNTTSLFTCSPLDHKGICAEDFDVVAENRETSLEALTSVNTSMTDALTMGVISQKCFDAVVESICLSLGSCRPEEISVDLERALKQCEKGKALCPSFMAKNTFNCTEKEILLKSISHEALKIKCDKIPDDVPVVCDLKDYKFPQHEYINSTVIFMIASQTIRLAEPPRSSQKCYETVKTTLCDAASNVCTEDGKYIVNFMSRQECENNIQCITDEPTKKILLNMCLSAPDANNSEKILYSSDATVIVTDTTVIVPDTTDMTKTTLNNDTNVPTKEMLNTLPTGNTTKHANKNLGTLLTRTSFVFVVIPLCLFVW